MGFLQPVGSWYPSWKDIQDATWLNITRADLTTGSKQDTGSPKLLLGPTGGLLVPVTRYSMKTVILCFTVLSSHRTTLQSADHSIYGKTKRMANLSCKQYTETSWYQLENWSSDVLDAFQTPLYLACLRPRQARRFFRMVSVLSPSRRDGTKTRRHAGIAVCYSQERSLYIYQERLQRTYATPVANVWYC